MPLQELGEVEGLARAAEASQITGLSAEQRRFLYRRLGYASDSECLMAMGIPAQKVAWWKRQPHFREAYDLLMNNPGRFARQVLDRLLTLALANIEHALERGLEKDATQQERRLATNTAMDVLKQRGLTVSDEGGDAAQESWEIMINRLRYSRRLTEA